MSKSLFKSLQSKLPTTGDGSHLLNPTNKSLNTNVRKTKKESAQKSLPSADVLSTERQNEASSVIYLGHLPKFFEEQELKGFFSQFGDVKRMRLSRSRRTGRPRGYSFVEFQEPEVATIVAKTMEGYLLNKKRLVSHVIPKDDINSLMFKVKQKMIGKTQKQRTRRAELEKKLGSENYLKKVSKNVLKKENKKKLKLAEMGYDFEYPSLSVQTSLTKECVGTLTKNERVLPFNGQALCPDAKCLGDVVAPTEHTKLEEDVGSPEDPKNLLRKHDTDVGETKKNSSDRKRKDELTISKHKKTPSKGKRRRKNT